ncbi:Mini-ribonuclease 3 [Acetonema longum]|uniref:Mini-ribonuclease 3 n=1 Tax=Acetonema longum DSM 6540 TaxID=1009370 RepID=F7NMH4_9FIRM|nr:ribonuclease III domain-containing protein [Acetonema longum]EGO62754.1 ribonuclease III [Acetonema longum DSM 6540]
MNFTHYQNLMEQTLRELQQPHNDVFKAGKPLTAEQFSPLVLAYVGDAFFTLYVRTRLLGAERQKVRVLHTYDAEIVSATMQAFAVHRLEDELSETELAVLKRGRNAKSTVPKSASVSDYRYSTGFEAVLGSLWLGGCQERLLELAGKAFDIIVREIQDRKKRGD